MLNSKTMRRLKSTLMIYADYESTLVVENNGMQNPKESYTYKYQKTYCLYIGVVCVDDKFKEPFRTYLGKDEV